MTSNQFYQEKTLTHVYNYKAFGLNIASDITFDELESTNSSHVDVTIREVAHINDQCEKEGYWFELSEDRLFFEVDDVGKFVVREANQIEYTLSEGVSLDRLRLFLLGSGLAGIFHQKKLVPLHAGVYSVKGKAILISGDSGAGKSTTGFGLLQKGHALMADDVGVLHLKNDHVGVCSGYPQVKLWEQSLALFDVSIAHLKPVVPDEPKYRVVPKNFCSGQQRLTHLFFLKRSDSEKEKIEEVSGMALLELLHQNIFRQFFAPDNAQTRALCFEVFSMLMKTTTCYLVERNPAVFGVEKLVPLLEELTQ